MFFRYQQTAKVLTVDDTFARLTDVLDNGDLQFEFVYSMLQKDLINFGAQMVTVSVYSKQLAPKPLLGFNHRGYVDTSGLVANIRTQVTDAKIVQQQRDSYLLAQRNSDPTAYVNNNVLPQLVAGAPTANIQPFNRPRLQLVLAKTIKQSNDDQPVLHRIINTAIVPDLAAVRASMALESPQELIYDMITRQGLDPSYVLNLTPRSQSEVDTHGGLSNPQLAQERQTDPASRLLSYYLFPTQYGDPPTTSNQVPDGEYVQVLRTQTTDSIEIPVTLTVPADKMKLEGADLTSLFVQFELVNTETGQAADTVTKTLNVSKHLQAFSTPRVPPIVKVTPSEISSLVNIEVHQVDPKATAVLIYQKPIFTVDPGVNDYTLIGSFNVTSQQRSVQIQVNRPLHSAVIYRVIAQGVQATPGFDFTNAVIAPARYTPIRSIALSVAQVDNGINVECRHIPTNVVAVQFLRWNLTTFDASYTTVGADVGFIDDATRKMDLVSTVDADVSIDNVYRYAARLIYLDGNTEDFGSAIIEFIQPSPGEVDTRIDNLQVVHDIVPNVTFDISTITVDTNLDAVKSMLELQGISQFFQGDIATQRDQLKDLIAHAVQRVDLTTGRRENFGVITTTSFDDSALRKNQAIEPLAYGHKYRYEIYPLLRAPETVFEALQKTVVDPTTKKPYSFLPSKFLHPIALNHGTLVSATGASQRYAKDPMSFGIIGAITVVEASFDDSVASIVDPQASRFDRFTNSITWGVRGDINQIDHFIIMKQVHGIRTAIGKAHSEFTYGTCQYLHDIDDSDEGVVSYIVVPVMNDYRIGAEAITNTVLIEAP